MKNIVNRLSSLRPVVRETDVYEGVKEKRKTITNPIDSETKNKRKSARRKTKKTSLIGSAFLQTSQTFYRTITLPSFLFSREAQFISFSMSQCYDF